MADGKEVDAMNIDKCFRKGHMKREVGEEVVEG